MLSWIASNLILCGMAALFLFIGHLAFPKRSRNRRMMLIASVALVGLSAAAIVRIVHAPPGREETIDEVKRIDPLPVIPDTALKRLQFVWNAEETVDWPVAETLALFSEAAYLAPIDAESPFGDLGFPNPVAIVSGSMIGYVATADDVTVIAFRGTDGAEVDDWLANIGRSALNTPHGAIHKGFQTAYLSLKPQLTAALSKHKSRHLWVTGHSLGGALALCCAYDLEETENLRIDGLMTFGQPMVARKDLARYLDEHFRGRYAHLVNGADVVPRVPPSHSHCGSLVWFTDGGIKRSMKERVYGAAPGNQVEEEDDLPAMNRAARRAPGLSPSDGREPRDRIRRCRQPKV